MFLNYGEPTSVNNDSDISDSAKANLRNKQLYIDNKGQFGVLHYGINEVSLAGLSIAQKSKRESILKIGYYLMVLCLSKSLQKGMIS